MSTVMSLHSTDDPRDAVHRAVSALATGELVGIPTETAYVIAANVQHPEAVERMLSIVEGDPAAPVMCLRAGEQAYDYLPRLSAVGRRLARRCWPGPVTMVIEWPGQDGLFQALPENTRAALVCDNRVALRVPDSFVIQETLSLLPAPIVIYSEHHSPAKTAAGLEETYGTDVSLILDAGPCRHADPPTIVGLSGEGWSVTTPGVVSESLLKRLASEVILFVCTGNTCRSPMAEGLFRKLLADRLQCTNDELVEAGYLVLSAGVAAAAGLPASSEAIQILSHRGIDISEHTSQPLTAELLGQADHIFAMTWSHRDAILGERPDLGQRVHLLSQDGSEIGDPIGGPVSEYEACLRNIERHLWAILERFPTRTARHP